MGLKFTIGVGGRFHSDHLAQALVANGHDVEIVSSFPRSRFPQNVRGLVKSRIAGELVYRAGRVLGQEARVSGLKMAWFGRALARQVQKRKPDILIAWSSFAMEAFETGAAGHRILIRDSTHISDQMEILANEYRRWGLPFHLDSAALKREVREYELADEIIVLSEIAKRSFVEHGIREDKIKILRLGVDVSRFRPIPKPLDLSPVIRIVYFGSLSLRKGIPYLAEAIKAFEGRPCEFHLVGDVEPGLEKVLRDLPQTIRHRAMPQATLAEFLGGMDLFVFPTLEDGFGQTLIQAMAAGVAPIVSDRCGAKDLIEDREAAIVVPSRNSAALIQAIDHLLTNPEIIGRMRERGLLLAPQVSWEFYAEQVGHLFPASAPALELLESETHSPA